MIELYNYCTEDIFLPASPICGNQCSLYTLYNKGKLYTVFSKLYSVQCTLDCVHFCSATVMFTVAFTSLDCDCVPVTVLWPCHHISPQQWGHNAPSPSYRAVSHCTILYCTTLHYTTLPCTVLHFTTLHCIIIHDSALHLTTLLSSVTLPMADCTIVPPATTSAI